MDSVVTIALSISRAIEYVHSQGIIYGNLCSRNVLIALPVVELAGFSEAMNGLVDGEPTEGLRKLDVYDFGYLLNVTGQQKVLNVNSGSSSQKGEIQESLERLVEARLSMDPKDRPEFTHIRQQLDIICITLNQHHNIVEAIVTTSGEAMYGVTLEEYMLELKPNVPNIRTAMTIALRISQAMGTLHAQGIDYRDLKSSQVVFLTKDKEFLTLRGLEHPSEEERDEMDLENFKSNVFNFSQIFWELLTNNNIPFHKYVSSKKEKRPILEGVPHKLMKL